MVDFERTHVVIQSTYKNILENYNPGVKQLITTGKALQKGLHNVSCYAKTYLSCLYDLARSAQGCEGGASELGDSLLQLSDAYNTINQQLIDGIKFFHSELLIPVKSKQENEFRHVQICLDKYMVGHKYHTARLVKSQFALAKMKKKIRPKQQGFNKKEVQCAREVKEYGRMLEEYMVKNLRLALLEERKRYCYLFSKLSGVAQNDGASSLKAHDLLIDNFKQWVLHCKNPNVLPPSSEKFIKELGFTEDSFPSIEEFPPGEPARRATLSGGEIPSSNVAAPAPAHHQTTLIVSPPTPQQIANKHEIVENSLPNQNHVMSRAVAKDDVVLTKYHTIGSVPASARAPNDVVDLITGSQSATDDLRSALFQLRALHSFKASNESQLTMEAGDVISVYDDVNQGGWIFGLNENTNRIGWFPLSYTQVAELESLKTLSERLANLEDVFVKRTSRSLQDSPNFNDAKFRKQMLLGEKAARDDLPPPDKFSDLSRLSQHGSEYDGQLTKVEERHEYVVDGDREGTLRIIRNQAKQIVDEPRYETYSSLRLKTLPPAAPQPISVTPRRSASRISSAGQAPHYGTLGKTHRSLGALYSENLLRDMSHGPPPPPPPLEISMK